MRGFASDVRYAWRQLQRTPVFTAAAVVTLALGIGTSTAFFGIVNALALKPIPGVNLNGVYSAGTVSLAQVRALEDAPPDSVIASAARHTWQATVHVPGKARQVSVDIVTAGYPRVFGLGSEAGAWFTGDDERGGAAVAVISDRLWREWFGGDPAIVGRRTMRVEQARLTIVGVASRGFRGPYPGFAANTDVWVPMGTWPSIVLAGVPAERRAEQAARLVEASWLESFRVATVVRAAAGADVVQLTGDLGPLLRSPGSEPMERPLAPTRIREVNDQLLPTTVGRFALTIVALASLVLVAACANLANMLYARGSMREAEVAVRLSLGASRARVMRLFAAETLVIAVLAGATGMALAAGGLQLFGRTIGSLRLSEVRWTSLAVEPALDYHVLAFAVAASALAALSVGLLAARRSSRVAPIRSLAATGTQTSEHGRGGWLHTALVSIQITAAVLLVMGAGAALETHLPQLSRRLHYDTSTVLAARVDLSLHEYTDTQGRMFIDRVLAAVRSIDGVEAAAVADSVPGGVVPVEPRYVNLVAEPPRDGPAGALRRVFCDRSHVTPGFLGVLGLRLVRGRDLVETDTTGAPLVAIISQSAARGLWPNDDAIGKRLQLGVGPWITVVGVTEDPSSSGERYQAYSPSAYAFVPFAQWYKPRMLVLARSPRASGLVEPLQQAVRSVDDELAIFETSTIDQTIVAWAAPRRAAGMLLTTLGGLALLIATAGVYGLIAYFVGRRTREFGLRLALGATPGQIAKMVFDHAVHIVLVGLLPGVFLAAVGSRVLEARVAMVFPNEIRTWAIVPLVVLAAGVVAGLLPARRASRVDPNTALREL